MSCIHYKFRSSLEYDTITFDGLAISLGDLKKSIMAQKKIAKVTDFDLEVTNAQTKEEYKDESTQIPKNSSVVVRRIPTGSRSKAQLAVDRGDTYASGLPKTKSEELHSAISTKQTKMIDLVNSDASEEDKLKVMMSQAGEGYQPNQYVKGRGRGYNPSGPLPPNYVCYRCGKPGHFIRNCPTNGVKRTIGIPRKFGEETPVETTADETITKKEPVKQLVPVQDTRDVKDRKVPSELKCPMCSNLLHDAVLIPCCGTSYCDECIRTYLLENDQECPTCGAEDVSPDSLIINKQLRQAVNNFRNARPASPFVNSTTTDKPTSDKPTSDKSATSTVDSPAQVNDKISSPSINVASPDVRSPDTSEKEKSEEKVTSTTSEVPSKETHELKKEELKKEGSPLVVKEELNSPRPDQSSDTEDRHGSNIKPQPPVTGGHRPEPSSYGPRPMHRGPGMMHPMAGEPIIPRSIAPEGAIVVPPIRAVRPVIHAAPLIQQPGFMAATSLGIHPVVPGHSSMVHPNLHMEPHLLGAQFPFAMKRPHPFDDGPPMSEEEFYRYQKKMKIRNKRKHRDKELSRDGGSRERSRERTTNKNHPANFDDELSQYRALQRHRHGNYRSRSHSRSRSISRSLSRSPSQSSHTMSKSPTPEDWDRSRTPSPSSQVLSDSKNPEGDDEKKHKRKKRKKHHKHKHSKKRKSEHNVEEELKKEDITTTVKNEKKSKSKKKSKEKSQKKEKMNTEKIPDAKENINECPGKEISNDKEEQKSDISKEVEIDNKQSKEPPQTEDKENEHNGTEPEEKEIKKNKKKSDESKEKSKHKSKEKSGEKKHKKKKHKRKHKKHKKEKDKSQSAEEKSESTEETQDSEGENGQQNE